MIGTKFSASRFEYLLLFIILFCILSYWISCTTTTTFVTAVAATTEDISDASNHLLSASEQNALNLQERINQIIIILEERRHRHKQSTSGTIVWIPPGDYNFSHSNFNITFARNLQLLVGRRTDKRPNYGSNNRRFNTSSKNRRNDNNMTDSHNATFWFSGQSGINVSHSSNVQLGGGIQQRQSPFLIIDYHPLPPPHTDFHETSGITLHLFNCSNITVHTVVIRAAPFMAVTAFQGYGNHIFSNIQLEPHPSREWVARRDAIHVSDLRLGPTLVNSTIGYTGDDFFNVHSTLLLVLNCSRISPQDASSPSINCLLVNPRVLPDAPRNTVYGTLSNLEFVQPGDVISFYQWPASDMAMRPILTDTKVRYLHDVSRQYGRDAQETLPSLLQYPPKTSWHEATNQTTKFEADEVWSVMLELNEPHHPYQYTPLPPLGSIATVDTISSAGAKIINNTFVDTNCNFGRFKSPGGVIQGNTFRQAGNENLELTALPQWLEGPVNVRDVQVVDNVFYVDQIQQLPVHCGPLCEHPGCDYGQCVQCPICDGYDTTWAKNITLQKNQIVPSIRATKEDSDAVDQTRH